MQIVIQNANALVAPWTSWFFYGPTGSGKTTAASTFPDPFFIVPHNEKSILALQGLDVPYTEVRRPADMDAALTYLEQQYSTMLQQQARGADAEAALAFPWQTIVIESLSHYSDLVVEDLSQNGRKKMDFEQWGKLSSHLRTIQNRLRAMDVHSVFTSLDQVSEDGQSGSPLISGQMKVKMPSACDFIGYCEVVSAGVSRPSTYRVHFRQFGKFAARVRQSAASVKTHGSFPGVIESFHFDKVAKYIGYDDAPSAI